MGSSGRATSGWSANPFHLPPVPLGATAGLTAAVSRTISTTSPPTGLQSCRANESFAEPAARHRSDASASGSARRWTEAQLSAPRLPTKRDTGAALSITLAHGLQPKLGPIDLTRPDSTFPNSRFVVFSAPKHASVVVARARFQRNLSEPVRDFSHSAEAESESSHTFGDLRPVRSFSAPPLYEREAASARTATRFQHASRRWRAVHEDSISPVFTRWPRPPRDHIGPSFDPHPKARAPGPARKQVP